MKQDQLLDQILPILHAVKDDAEKLQRILDFLLDEIYEEQDEALIIPVEHREIMKKIAESIDCGLVCFFNPDTLEIEEVPLEFINDPEEYESITGEAWDETFKHAGWEKCITVNPPESFESFKIMEQFIDEIEDNNLQSRLVHALRNRKPFANFKNIIENSKYREAWFSFKQLKLELLVWGNLSYELTKDDGEKPSI